MVTKGKVLMLTNNTIDLLDVSLLVVLSVGCKFLLLRCITKFYFFCSVILYFSSSLFLYFVGILFLLPPHELYFSSAGGCYCLQ